MGKLENTLKDAKLIARASILFPCLIAYTALLILGEELKGSYYRTFKIPHIAHEHNDFVSYIRTDKEK
jgi:hypothetical protein